MMNSADVPSPLWSPESTAVFRTGTWRNQTPVYDTLPSPCHAACPVGGEIATWVGRVRDGDLHGAWLTLVENNPFPAVAGRICHHPCESACNRDALDGAVSICQLERAVGDRALAENWQFPEVPVSRDGRIAVIGGGPSGLSLAYQLRRRGYAVTLFEAREKIGGLLRYGIPPYRLADDVLDGEIHRILALGVQVQCGIEIDADRFARLHDDYDAVYVATGATRSRRLPALAYDRDWVLDGAEYLALTNAGITPRLGKRIVVIGGGSAALDAARTARRHGHVVTILALESAAQLPAQREEVDEAIEEGILLAAGAMLESVTENDDGTLRLTCRRVEFVPGEKRGEFTVTPARSGKFELDADAVVPSIGQQADLAPFAGKLTGDDALLGTDDDLRTSDATTWAGGDVASMERFVTAAIGMGKRAAWGIERALDPEAETPAANGLSAVPYAAINPWYHPPATRAPGALRPVAERLDTFDEVQLALDAEAVLAESRRCFSCGTCILCDNCLHHCPDMAVRRVDGGYEILGDYCKGCGLCVKECPTGSIQMRAGR